jgi:hypothetical protein
MTAPNFNIYDVPVIGPWTAKVGHITDMWGNPCSVSNQVGFYAFWQALPRLIITLTKPDSFDLVTERWGKKHKRRRLKRFKIEDLILPIKPPNGIGPAWVFYHLGHWAERAGWYMLVVDATLDFAIHWTSTAYSWSGCEVPGSPYCNMNSENDVVLTGDAGDFTFSSWNVQHQVIFAGDSTGIACPAGYDVSCGFELRQVPLGVPLPEGKLTGVKLIDTVDGRVWAEDRDNGMTGPLPGFGAAGREWGFNQPAHDLTVVFTKTEGFIRVSGSIWASGIKSTGLTYDP